MFLRQKSTIGDYSTWEMQEIGRINALSDERVMRELKEIMRGGGYSWHTISQRLRKCLVHNGLEIEHFEAGNILYEWNVLCDERVSWLRCNRPSFRNTKFNRACLTNLKIIPTQAGLGIEGRGLAMANVDCNIWVKVLTVDNLDLFSGKEEFRGANGYFYAEGPEFRLEYIHERVED